MIKLLFTRARREGYSTAISHLLYERECTCSTYPCWSCWLSEYLLLLKRRVVFHQTTCCFSSNDGAFFIKQRVGMSTEVQLWRCYLYVQSYFVQQKKVLQTFSIGLGLMLPFRCWVPGEHVWERPRDWYSFLAIRVLSFRVLHLSTIDVAISTSIPSFQR